MPNIFPGNYIEYYNYDIEGRLAKITQVSGDIETFGYDGDGNRISRTIALVSDIKASTGLVPGIDVTQGTTDGGSSTTNSETSEATSGGSSQGNDKGNHKDNGNHYGQGNVMNPLTLNRYAYTGNNPVMNVDPKNRLLF